MGAIGVGAGVYRYYYTQGSTPVVAKASKPRDTVFKGGDQGFLDLKLSEIEVLSHNTKRYRFEFPDKDAVSGLHVACEFFGRYDREREGGRERLTDEFG